VASALVREAGEERCRAVLAALASRPRIRNQAGWCVRCLQEGWEVEALRPDRPRAHHAYRPAPAPDEPPPDPRDLLPAATADALEAEARAQLIAELPRLRASLEAGRSLHLVRKRVREMLDHPP
jgi:hypothetical protein